MCTTVRRLRRQRGAILVEFAFIAFLMYLMIAIVLDFGRLFFSAQAAQDAARTAARELSVIPLPPDMTLTQALADPRVRTRIYQREHLVIDLDNIPGGLPLQAFLDSLPVLNQALRPLMIFDHSGGRRLLRYPGTLVADATAPSGLSVAIPYVTSRNELGKEHIVWVPVLEEILNPSFPSASPFSMTNPPSMPQRGLVAVRINYPFQAATLSAYRPAPQGVPNIGNPTLANDGRVFQDGPLPTGQSLLPDTGEAGPYTGTYGLGKLYAQGPVALGLPVRPVYKLISAQAIFRREVFD